jgi:hypothetical protein
VKLNGGPLDGQSFDINVNTTRLAVKPEAFGEGSPCIGEYRRENGWNFVSLEGRA